MAKKSPPENAPEEEAPVAEAPVEESPTKATKKRAVKKAGKTAKRRPKKARKKTAKRAVDENAADSSSKDTKVQKRNYPAKTLEDALVVSEKIKEKNNGNAWRTEDVATACGYSNVRSAPFFYLTAASRDYGLTVGSNSTEKIELSDLGREIVYAGTKEAREQNKRKAFFNVDMFKKVYTYYGGSANLPEEKEFLSNTLTKEFGLAKDLHDEFIGLFKANCKYLNIESGGSAGTKVVVEGDGKAQHDSDEHGLEIRVIGEPKGKFDRTAFVIMPFVEKGANPRAPGFFAQLLEHLIAPAGNAAGFAIETAQQEGTEVIQSTIVNKLLEADLVIADLTDHNPNVLFELGIRIAKEKPVALIKAVGTGAIFDVDHLLRVKTYSPNLWPSTVKTDLPILRQHFKATWDNRETNQSYMQTLRRQKGNVVEVGEVKAVR